MSKDFSKVRLGTLLITIKLLKDYNRKDKKMSEDISGFLFIDDYQSLLSSDSVKVLLNKEIASKDALFDIFAEKLSFPEYFGRNWDAWWECLYDLSWLNVNKIEIVNIDIPLSDLHDKKIYLDLLLDKSRTESNIVPPIIIYFSRKDQKEVERILSLP